MYDPSLDQPLRDEVTALGVKALRTPQEVVVALGQPGTAFIFVNWVCGCAAGGARPALRMSLKNAKKPTNLYTVFAGMETEATAKAREFFKPYRPSSPQIGILKDGKLVKMFQRQDIEGRDPSVIAQELVKTFNELG
jgi:putative YphP/YqiW family bacilliredoxin